MVSREKNKSSNKLTESEYRQMFAILFRIIAQKNLKLMTD